MTMNLPTLLTLSRLIIGPLVVPVMCAYLLPMNNFAINVMVGLVFLFFGLTDLLDGYLARRWGNETQLGKLLDFMADKFLVYSSLIGLIAAQKIYFVWVLIFIGREFFVMGIRLLALESKISVPVSYFGKIKTMAQIAYIAAAIINPDHHLALTASTFNMVEKGLLFLALALTLYSAYHYYQSLFKSLDALKVEDDHYDQPPVDSL